MSERQILVRVTAADCRRDTFRCGGKGGQNVNKRDAGVRFTHLASGAVGESREERSQVQNERKAWVKMAESPRFRAWLRLETAAKAEGYASIDRKIDALMDEKNLRIETGVPARPGDLTERS